MTVTAAPTSPGHDPRIEALRARFRPVFARIAEGAVAREQQRQLAYDAVGWLREAGFTALRVPEDFGGGGVRLTELFALITELAAADSNLPQIIRAHFGFVEALLAEPDRAKVAPWLRLVADGAIFGAAMAEQTSVTSVTTTLTPQLQGGWRLDGHKYYSTGTLYADWISVIAAEGDDRVLVAIEADAPGVERVDDWDGFGQRLTGSGTTRFDGVDVPADRVIARNRLAELPSEPFFTAFWQQFHLATLAGIGRAILRDAIAFTLPRSRTFYRPGRSVPREDAVVQRVIGRLSALAFSAETLAARVAASLDAAAELHRSGPRRDSRLIAVEIEAYQAQQIILEQVLEAANLLFEVGGASAVSQTRALDRHWRNARVLASHNPAAQRERDLGDWYLNGVLPADLWARNHAAQASSAQQAEPAAR